MYIETMQQVFSNSTKVMVDVRSGSPLVYLPLDKLVQSSTSGTGSIGLEPSGAGAVRAAPAAEGSVQPPAVEARSRDAQRSRERESR